MKGCKILTAGIMLAMVALGAPPAFAKGLPGGAEGPGLGHGPGALKAVFDALELKLSDSQQKQMTGIIQKYEPGLNAAEDALRNARVDFGTVIHAENFNEERVREAFRKRSAAEEELLVLRAKMLAEIKASLNPEQLAWLNSKWAEQDPRFLPPGREPPRPPR